MPRFYFDIDDGERESVDRDGVDLPDTAAALVEASRALPGIALHLGMDGLSRRFASKVRDESDRVVLRATLMLADEWTDPLPRGDA